MRADRLLSIVLLLQTHRRLTAGALADLLEVSERTIQRDMEALSLAGIPVYADRGIGGGWSLLEGFATQLTNLTPTEIETLFLAKPASLLLDLGMDKAANTALDKLLPLLPALHRREAEVMRQNISPGVRSEDGGDCAFGLTGSGLYTRLRNSYAPCPSRSRPKCYSWLTTRFWELILLAYSQ